MEGKRTGFVDMARGAAILCVVLYHLIAPCGAKTVLTHLADTVVIVFFFYSGYFHKPGKRSLSQELILRVKKLMVPFLKYSLLFWLAGSVVLVVSKEETIQEAFLCLRNYFAGCIWNRTIQDFFGWEYYSLGKRYMFLADLWFFVALMLASVLFLLIADHVLKSRAKTLAAVCGLVAVTGVLRGFKIFLPYNIQLTPFWAAVMLLGAFFGYNRLFDIPSLSGSKELILGIISLVSGFALSMLKAPNVNNYRGTFPENEILAMILCLAASILLIWGAGIVSKHIEAAGVRVKELCWIGSHSLLIYVYHVFIAWVICRVTGFSTFYEEDPGTGVILKSCLLTAAVLAVCILLCIAEDKIKKQRA